MLPIVGIGASAGGLDAFKKFLSTLPAESGMAFVLIQHLDPTRESLTAELVGTYTRMRVVQAEDAMPVEANRVYVIPPGAYLSIRDRTLQLSTPTAPRSLRMAVDFFLSSLAKDQREHAIGVILSGTGTDGTLGLKEIKASGGMTMVQDPRTVRHDGMPRSAIVSADHVLPAERMAAALLAHLRHLTRPATSIAAMPADEADPLTAALEVLRTHTGMDFGGYKKGTMRRRIQRRMGLRQFAQMADYVELLRSDPTEAAALFKDLLISVTSFFREPAAWVVLQEQVIRRVVAEKNSAVPIRVWIPACATGEEPYSMAMLLIEEIEAAGKDHRFQIFASDVDAGALETARAGRYPAGIAAHISVQRLARFFVKSEHGYQVKGELRDALVFAQQSVLSDPPFSRLDVVSCRNLFIYLESAVQERIIPLLHFALLDGGYLFLGGAEAIGLRQDLFEAVASKWRIYRRVGPTRHDELRSPLVAPRAAVAAAAPHTDTVVSRKPGRTSAMEWAASAPPSIAEAVPSNQKTVRARPLRGVVGAAGVALVHRLEQELQTTKQDLRQTIEDLRAANEELMSVNEEFQSSNEELETSKEELQSLNEELVIANAQLEGKIAELGTTNNDLDNLLTSTNIATLFLDPTLCIRRFTPAATQLFSLIASDIGRPLSDIAQKFTDPALLPDIATALRLPVTPKTEVLTRAGRWFVRQVLPYRTSANETAGVVITFSDVAAEALQEARLYAESIVDTVREPLLVLDCDLRVRSANRSFYATFRLSAEETVGRLLYELANRQWDIPKLRVLLGEVLPQRQALDDFELEADFASIGPRIMRLNARAIDRGDQPYLILLAIEDITEHRHAADTLRESEARKHSEEQVRQRQAELSHALRISTVGELATGLAHELNQPLSAIANGVEACARYVRAGKANPSQLLALLDDASEEALRAGSIVEHLRHFVEKGKPQLERTDLREIARNVPRLLGREIQQAQIVLQLNLHPRPLPIYADRIQIEQIIVNLMQNAIDAIREAPCDHNEIQLQVGAAKGVAEVVVRDTGAGVSAAAAERMFEPFFTTKPRGLGMGLAISRSILEAHRGRIWVKRRADGVRGTAIHFTLPLSQPNRTIRKRRATGKKRAT